MKKNIRKFKEGFTLIEMLVNMLIVAVITVAIFTMFNQTNYALNISKNKNEAITFANGLLDLIYNDKNHQKENTECGIYCLHFLTNMLQGTKFKQYLRKPLRDKDMEKYREIFFIRNENNNVTL